MHQVHVMHGQKLPWKESDTPQHQNNPYGWSKRVNECQFILKFYKQLIKILYIYAFWKTRYGPIFNKNIVEAKK